MKLSQLALSYGFAVRLILELIWCFCKILMYSPEAYCTHAIYFLCGGLDLAPGSTK